MVNYRHKQSKFFFNKESKLYKDNIDALMIDANCMLHPQCFKILGENPNFKNKNKLEEQMIEQCLKYLEYIINFTNPKKLIYIAIDVAPIAKIKQQRMRRFKTVKTRHLFDNIKKHKKPIIILE